MSLSSSVYQAQREAYRHKLMFELMFHDDEQVDLKRYIRAFVSLVFLIDYISRFYQTALEELFDAGIVI
jgi:hypothetical protein